MTVATEPSPSPKSAATPTSCYWINPEELKLVPPYLRDGEETPEPVICQTSGVWPSWVCGSFMRVGTGRVTIPLSEDGSEPPAITQHFFDSLAMVHKFDISNGKVRYNSRHTAEGIVRKAKATGAFQNMFFFGPNANPPLKDTMDPCQALLGRQQSLFVPVGHLRPDESNFNVVVRRGFHIPADDNPYSKPASENPQDDEIIVHTESPYFQVCDSRTLEPKRILSYATIDESLKGVGSCAHPLKDRKRGEIVNYLISDQGVLNIFCVDIDSNPSRLKWKTALPTVPCYTHSLAFTDKYVVFIRNPVIMDLKDLNKPLLDAFTYEEDSPTFFFVLERTNGKHVATFKCPNFMFFHSVNAYDYVDPETGKTNIHVDLCAYDGSKDHRIPYREYTLSNVIDPQSPFMQGHLVRYELADIHSSAAVESAKVFIPAGADKCVRATVKESIALQSMELPRINKFASCKPGYRYVYAVGGTGVPAPGTKVPIGRLGNGVKFVECAFFSTVVRSDWETGEVLTWRPENGESGPCEPCFIPNPDQKSEDDGLVLTIVLDKYGKHSYLVALDAHNMKEVARAELPHVYSLAPHGTYVQGDGMFSGDL